MHVINRWTEENEEQQDNATSGRPSEHMKSFSLLNLLGEAGGLLYALNIIAGTLISLLGSKNELTHSLIKKLFYDPPKSSSKLNAYFSDNTYGR